MYFSFTRNKSHSTAATRIPPPYVHLVKKKFDCHMNHISITHFKSERGNGISRFSCK